LNRKEIPLALAATIATSIVLAACGSSSSSGGSGTAAGNDASSSTKTTTVRYEATAGSASPLEVASYLGYLPGIKLDQVGTVLGGPASLEDLATSQSDIGEAFNGTILNSIAAGAKIKAVVGAYGSNQTANDPIVVLADSGITSAKQLIGKSVGVNTLGANATYVTQLWLQKEGLTPAQVKQVNFVVIPPASGYEALVVHKLTALYSSTAQLAAVPPGQPKLRVLTTDVKLIGNYTGGDYALRTDWMQQNPAATKTLVSGIAKAIVWLGTQPLSKVRPVLEKVATLHGRSTDIPVLKKWTSLGIAEKGGYIRPIDFTPWIKVDQANGTLKAGQNITLSDLYTNQYNPDAPSGGGS
jgi:ABC-type nitrate/sulfonate/bicarbonate transport system substrate-binding protein